MSLRRSDLKEPFRKLAIQFKPPEDIDGLLGLWIHEMKGIPVDAVQKAVDQYISDRNVYWPKVWMIKDIALGIVAPNTGPTDFEKWERKWRFYGKPCPCCGAKMEHDGRRFREAQHDWEKDHPRSVEVEGRSGSEGSIAQDLKAAS